MKHASRTARWMAGCLLALWCVAFLRAETTEKSMVRALFLRQGGQGWTVSLLYQFPEAAADASDAESEIRACTAEGETLERAIQTAEQALPKTANYRLCEYLLFDEAASQTELLEVQEFLQTKPVSRLSARAFLVEQTAPLQQQAEPLLQCAEDHAAGAPHLYEAAGEMILPVVRLEEETAALSKESRLLTAQGSAPLSSEETAMAQLLQEKLPVSFELEESTITLRRCVVSVEAEGEGFAVALTGQRKAGTPPVSEVQCRQLEALCTQTLARCWENGLDLLHLGAVRALKQGSGEKLTTKNAYPAVRVSVEMLEF